jgi:hypothetical protein
MAVTVIGLDTAKHVFQVHGIDAAGRTVLRKRLKRSQVAEFFSSIPPCLVGLEATLTVMGGPFNGARLVDIEWNGQALMMFTDRLRECKHKLVAA